MTLSGYIGTAAASLAILFLPGTIGTAAYADPILPNLPIAPQKTAQNQNKPELPLHIPFRLNGTDIIFSAQLAGKTLDCCLDTGGNVIIWPSRLNLPGKRSFFASGVSYDAAGNLLNLSAYILSSIQLDGYTIDNKHVKSQGNYTVHDILTEAASPSKSKDGTDLPDYINSTPLLNASLFRNTILTIDFEHSELIVSSENGNFLQPKQPSGTLQIDFTMETDDPEFIGVPVVVTDVEGISARMILDTAWNRDSIGVLPQIYQKIKEQRKQSGKPEQEHKISVSRGFGEAVETNALDGVSVVPGFSPEQVKGPVATKLVTTAEEVQAIAPDTDGVLGGSFLHHFARVTFGFPRQKLLLEPYSAQ